jgi:hypothetical protein
MSKRRRSTLSLLVALLVSPAFAAAQGGPPATAPVTSAVRTSPVLALSDEVLDDVARLRQLKVLRPVENGLKSRDDIRSIVLKDLAESTTPAKLKDSTAFLRFLGLVPPDFELERETVALLTEQIAGFYDPKSKVFYLADWIPIEEQRTIIAHELVHALADQHFNLRRFEKWPEGDSDAELAARALVEGDATALMIAYTLDARGIPADIGKLPVSLTDLLREGANAADPEHPIYSKAPEVLRQSLQFPYVSGAGFVQTLLREGSWARVGDAYRALPTSTEQIMHPEKYLAGEHPVAVKLPDVAASFGAGWRLASQDVNGEFGYFLILKDRLPEAEAAAAAAGWGGDRYAFYRDPSGERAGLVHVSTWDTPADATEFFAAYAERSSRRYGLTESGAAGPLVREWATSEGVVRIERAGNRVAIVEGLRGSNAAAVVKRLLAP